MLTFTLRRLLLAIPTLLVISLVIFLLVDLAPGSPMSEIPLTVPPDVRQKMIEALGADQPVIFRYFLWLRQFFWVEPLHLIDHWFGTHFGEGMQRVISWQTRSPVSELILQRLPVTLRRDGQPLLTVDVEVVEGQTEYKVLFPFTPERVGKYLYEITTPPLPGEAIAEEGIAYLKEINFKGRAEQGATTLGQT